MSTLPDLFQTIGEDIKGVRERVTALEAGGGGGGGGGSAVTSVAGRTGAVTLTKSDVGLSAVDNTSDANKPISAATQAALNAKQATLVSGTTIKTVNGVSLLGAGDLTISGGGGGGSAVTSVAGRTGDVTLAKADVGLSNVDNTSDISKPISTATQTALDGKAAASHTHAYSALTGLPTLGTAAALDVPASGDAAAGQVVKGSDSRLSDARTPTTHTHAYGSLTGLPTLGTAAALNVPASGNAASGEVVKGSDTRLTDARAPTTHTHATADVTGLDTALAGKQDALVSGTNIKTVNGSSLLGSGDLTIAGGGGGAVSTTALQSAAPSTPSAGNISRYGRDYGGRPLHATIGADGVEQIMQPLMARRAVSMCVPVWNTSSATLIGLPAANAVGTATAATYAATNRFTAARRVEYLVTTAATTAVAGARWQYQLATRSGGFHAVLRFGLATGVATSTHRAFAGLIGSTGNPSDVNPSTLSSIIGLGYDAGDTQLQIMSNDATGTATKIALGASFPKPSADRTSFYEVSLFSAPGASSVGYEVTDLATGAVAACTISTDLPASTQTMIPSAWCSVGGTSSVIGLALMGLYLETDI